MPFVYVQYIYILTYSALKTKGEAIVMVTNLKKCITPNNNLLPKQVT